MSNAPAPALVVGVGNADCGDDGVGLLVARLVRQRGYAESETVRAPLDIIDLLAGRKRAVIVDACQCEVPRGTVLRFDLFALREAWASGTTTFGQSRLHGFEVIDALRLADAFGVLPDDTVVLLVAGRRFALGTPISKAVRRGALDAVAWIADYVGGDEARHGVERRVLAGRAAAG